MGKRDRERRERLIEGERRIKESGRPAAVERFRDLAVMAGCKKADESQAMMVMTMGADWGPIECPHCGTAPLVSDLLKDRPSCEEIGHPEQFQAHLLTGQPFIECVLCGETPEFVEPPELDDPPDEIAKASLAERVETCGANGHRRAAQLLFYNALADGPELTQVPCEVCGRTPDLLPMLESDPPAIMEAEPDRTVHMHLIALP